MLKKIEKDKRSKKSTLLLIAIVAFPLIVAIIAVYNHYLFSSSHHHATDARYAGVDKFGIKEIYPTKSNGDEWYMNMNDIIHDPRTSFTASKPITKNPDGSWKVSSTKVRFNVYTSSGYHMN